MVIGRVEFVLMVALIGTHIVFTPEPLVLFRKFCVWCLFPLLAWHGYGYWQNSPLMRQIITTVVRDGSIRGIADAVCADFLRASADHGYKTALSIQKYCTDVFTEAYNYLKARLLSQWSTPTVPEGVVTSAIDSQSDSEDPQTTPSAAPSGLRYYAILVTTPPVHVYGLVSDQICAVPDRPSLIPWSATATDSLPAILPNLTFRRHFGVCLIPKHVWESQNMTLSEKFQGQLFWDHRGEGLRLDGVYLGFT
jgi:hypothetical protein